MRKQTTHDLLERARHIMAESKTIVAFSGAGLSAESGVPTFRDAQTDGLWSKHDPMKLASPEGFAADAQLVIDWYAFRRKAIAKAQPNEAHKALAARSDIFNVTQNVDDLFHRAGTKNIVQLHGTIARDHCHGRCGYEEAVELNNPPGLRNCATCGSPMRPAVVWFGEMLPGNAWRTAEEQCSSCDVLLVIGTSAVVYPAAGLIDVARQGGARIVVVNTQPSEASAAADVELLGKAGAIVPALLKR